MPLKKLRTTSVLAAVLSFGLTAFSHQAWSGSPEKAKERSGKGFDDLDPTFILKFRSHGQPAAPAAASAPVKLTSDPLFAGRTAGVAFARKGAGTFLYPRPAMQNALTQFPKSSSFLTYQNMDTTYPGILGGLLSDAQSAGIIPEIAFETGQTLDVILKDLKSDPPAGPGYDPAQHPHSPKAAFVVWAKFLAASGQKVYFRPFSEMNDGRGSWEWLYADPASKERKYQDDPVHPERDYAHLYAEVWTAMRAIFRIYKADNVKFLFVAVGGAVNHELPARIANLIAPGDIDAMGVNPYARSICPGMKFEPGKALPPIDVLVKSCEPIPLSELVESWRSTFDGTPQKGLPFVLGEYGVTNNPFPYQVGDYKNADLLDPNSVEFEAWDMKRAQWIHEAFAYARGKNFNTLNYFNYEITEWRMTDPTTHKCKSYSCFALADEIAKYGK